MKRKPVTEIVHGDVLIGYCGEGKYERIGTFGEYVPRPDDPKVGEGMLKFSITDGEGRSYSAFYPPVGSVVVKAPSV